MRHIGCPMKATVNICHFDLTPQRRSHRGCLHSLAISLLVLGSGLSAWADSGESEAILRGNEQYCRFNYVGALRYYNGAVLANTNHAPSYNNLGLAFMRLGRYSEADAAFGQAKAVSTNVYVAPYLNKAKSLCRQGRLSEGLAEVTAGLVITNSDRLFYQKGWIEDELGQTANALVSLDAALLANPSNSWASALRGVIKARQGQTNSAVSDFYLSINAKSSDIVSTLTAYNLQRLRATSNLTFQSQAAAIAFTNGLYWMRLEQFAGADGALRQAQALDGTLPDIPYVMSLCRIQSGNAVGASSAMLAAQSNMIASTVDRFNADLFGSGDVFVDGIKRGSGPITVYLFPSQYDLVVRGNRGGLKMEWMGPIYADGTPGGNTNIIVNPTGVTNYSAFAPIADTDRDWMADSWETAKLGGLGIGPQQDLPDGDGLINLLEFQYFCNPNAADTDGDGTADLAEIIIGSDPVRCTRRYYVDDDRPDDLGDGLSWGTAKQTIQAAIDIASEVSATNDSAVLVTNGVYNKGFRVTRELNGSFSGVDTVYNRLVVSNNIILRSVNGREVTIIEGSGTEQYGTTNAIRCVRMTKGVVDGFTMRRGATLGCREGVSEPNFNWDMDMPISSTGGGICMYNAAEGSEVRNCRIINNIASFGGGVFGVVYPSSSGPGGTLNRCDISQNEARQYVVNGTTWGGYGGGAHCIALNKCSILDNLSSANGGGIYMAKLTNCTLIGNSAGEFGGGSYFGILSHCDVKDNSALVGGGAYNSTLYNCTFSGNSARSFGAGAVAGQINDCLFLANSAESGGGTCAGVLNGCLLIGNTASYGGGGSIGGTLNNCTLIGNRSLDGGGGLWGSSAFECTLISNASVRGGGAFLYNSSALEGCLVLGNTATNGGGAYGADPFGTSTMRNSVLARNSAGQQGGAFYSPYGTCTGANVTIVGSTVGGIAEGTNYGNSIVNSIAWNSETNGSPFVDIGHGDYRLRATSTYVNAGSNSNVVGAVDIYGAPRIQDGIVDMGAFEGGVDVGAVVALPVFSPPPGASFVGTTNCTVTCATGGAEIHYTLDNTTPTAASPLYVGPLAISNTTLVKARAFKTGLADSGVALAIYMQQGVATPVLSPGATNFVNSMSVSIACATAGAAIRYTTDSTTPTTNSLLYILPITVSNTTTIKAKAFVAGMSDSFGAIMTYTLVPVATPVFTPPSGTEFLASLAVGIASTTETAEVHYTTDNTTPSRDSTLYTAPIVISNTTIIRATAFKAGMANSEASAIYTNLTPAPGAVIARGYNYYGECNVPAGLTGVVAVAGGGNHTVALRGNGTVAAWWYNDYKQCDVPTGLTNATGVSAGDYHSGALKRDGVVVVWGVNTNELTGQSNMVAIASAAYWNMGVKQDGTVIEWKTDGLISTNTPTNLVNVTEVARGKVHSVAVRGDGSVVAWGDNTYGQCNVPSNLTGVIEAAAGQYHSVAVKWNGSVVAWGDNTSGQCNVPTNLEGVLAVAAGDYHTVALKSDGSVVAWGKGTPEQRETEYFYGQSCLPYGTGFTAIAAGPMHTVLVYNGPIVAKPTFSAAPGTTFGSSLNITMSCATVGATIRYTINGAQPTATSAIYTTPIILSATATIKAKAFKDGLADSEYAAATFIQSPTPVLIVLPLSHSFASVSVNTAAQFVFTVKNAGGGVLTGNAGGVSSPFSIIGGTNYVLNDGATTNICVRFAPTTAGTYSNNLAFNSSVGNLLRPVTGTATNTILCPEALDDAYFGVMSNRFGFNINWTSGQVVVVDASTNLTQTNWIPLVTGTLTGVPYYFFDSKWTNYIDRFYRIRSQ